MKNYLVFLFALLAASQSVRADGVPLPVYSPVKRMGAVPKNPAVNSDPRIVLGEMTVPAGSSRVGTGPDHSLVFFTVPVRNVSKERLSVELIVGGFTAKGQLVVELKGRRDCYLSPGAQDHFSIEGCIEKSTFEQVVEWRGTDLRVTGEATTPRSHDQPVRTNGVPLPVCSSFVKRMGPAPKNPAVNSDPRITFGEMTMTQKPTITYYRRPGHNRDAYVDVSFTVPVRNVSKERLSVELIVAGFNAKGEQVVELRPYKGSALLPGLERNQNPRDAVAKSLVDQVVEWRVIEVTVKEGK